MNKAKICLENVLKDLKKAKQVYGTKCDKAWEIAQENPSKLDKYLELKGIYNGIDTCIRRVKKEISQLS